MNLTENPETVHWPLTHYAFFEATGPFSDSAWKLWTELHGLVPQIESHNTIAAYVSLYKPEEQIYRAGVALAAPPAMLPAGMQSIEFPGGSYAKFVLRGSYAELPEATSRAFDVVAERAIALRDDFCIEHYVTDPRTTPEAEAITEILLPLR